MDELSNPIWTSLTGAHSALGYAGNLSAVYREEIAPFAALREPTAEAFLELKNRCDPGRTIAFFTTGPLSLPSSWELLEISEAKQLIYSQLTVPFLAKNSPIISLGKTDIPDMLRLAEATRPGPFSAQTIRCGRYIGVRNGSNDELVGMAGQRLRASHAVEISAVCTAATHRGHGIAKQLVLTLASEAIAQGVTPFMHVRATNHTALALYERLGFEFHQDLMLTRVRTPSS